MTDYENSRTMKDLRGPLSRRATSAEFNEWNAHYVCEYIDTLRAQLATARADALRAAAIELEANWPHKAIPEMRDAILALIDKEPSNGATS